MELYLYIGIGVLVVIVLYLLYLSYCASSAIYDMRNTLTETEHQLYITNEENSKMKSEMVHLKSSLESFKILEKFSNSMISTVKTYEEKIRELETKLSTNGVNHESNSV